MPHINQDGQICTLPIGTVVNPFRPSDQIRAVLANAKKVVERRYSPEEEVTEIEEELVAYWRGDSVIFLTDNTLETHRVVRVALAEEMHKATAKRVHYVAAMPAPLSWNGQDGMEIGLVVDVPRSNIVEFLNNPAKTILQNPTWRESCALLARFLSPHYRARKCITVYVFARCHTRPGDVWLGAYFLDLFLIRKSLTENEKDLPSLAQRSPFHRCSIESLRTERLIRRAEGPATGASMRDKAVAIIGCGSVGSFIADLLVRSGTKRLLLVDKESLESANLARHILGVSGLFLPKADQLRRHIIERFPESVIQTYPGDVRHENGLKSVADFGGALNVIATGDTNTDMRLSELCRLGRSGACCFVWVEAGLQAGHIVYQPRGCQDTLQDLHPLGADGRYFYRHRTVADPERSVCQEHACQFTFTPYSAVDVVAFAAASTRKVLDWLSQPPQTMQVLRWRTEGLNQWEDLAAA